MGRLDYSKVEIKVVSCGPGRDASTEHWIEVPDALDPGSVEDFVIDRFGEPSDVALRSAGALGEVVRGWVYPADAGILQLAELSPVAPTDEILIVPFVRFDDGSRRELFTYASELNHAFAEAIAPLGAPQLDCEQLAPGEASSRLAQERAWLVGDESLLELQIAGWLRRMVEEQWTFLILDAPATGRYVQFLVHGGDWLRGEAVGDRYLDGHPPLTHRERSLLSSVGWNEPFIGSDSSGNHWFEWIADLSAASGPEDPACRVEDDDVLDAAHMAARTLTDVFTSLRMHDIEVHTGPASMGEA